MDRAYSRHCALMMAAVLAMLAGLMSSEAAAADGPNVILIMTDDQGYGDFGSMGNDVIRTPALDDLAEQSAAMSDFYVSPVCSPTRASLMTGRYNYRTRVVDTWQGRSMMDPAEVTIAELLSRAGYRTGIFGKWHLGDNYPMRPIDQGFDRSIVHLGGGIAQPSEPRGNRRQYTDPLLFDNGRKVATHGYCSDVYTDDAIDFIRQADANGEPFFAYLAFNAPHGPFHDVPEELYQQYREQADALAELIVPDLQGDRLNNQIDRLARIAAMITNLDANIGRLLRELDELDIADDTLVIYLNDNGPNSRRFVGPFRGMKTEVYEGGVRSPLWVRWPGELEPGVASSEPAAHIDIMPTILQAAGVEPPDDLHLDGRSLLPLLKRESDVDWPERAIALQSHRGDVPQRYHHFMIRRGPWKLVNNSGFGREQFEGDPAFELYNVEDDPGETDDLAEQEPDVLAELKAEYDAWFEDVSTTREDNFAPPRIVVGHVEENPVMLTRQDWQGESWQQNATGGWLVRVVEPGPYDVSVLFDPGDEPETATLMLDDRELQRQISPGTDAVHFENVSLSAGEQTIEALLTGEDTRRGAYQIRVQRRQAD